MRKKSTTIYTVVAITFGLPFILIGWSLAIYSANLPWTLASIPVIHNQSDLIYLLDTVPVLLFLALFFVVRARLEKRENHVTALTLTSLKLISRTMADGFITITEEGAIMAVNGALEKMFGYEEKELVDKDINTLMPASYAEGHKLIIKRLKSHGVDGTDAVSGRAVEGRKRDGTIFPASITISELEVDGVSTFNAVVRDITELKRAQAEATKNANELVLFVGTANAPIFGIDSEGLVNEWNHAAERITGFSKAEVLGKELVAEFITDEYKAPVKQVLDNALHGDESSNYEFPLYTKTSQRVDVLLNATTRRNADGGVVGVIGVGQDITLLKQVQAEALKTAEEMTQFVDTANAPIFGIDADGLVNEWNQTAEKITGFSKAEVLGKDLVAEFITDEYKGPVKQVLDNALRGEETANYEFPLYTKTSQRVDVLLNATTRRNFDGQVVGVIGVGQDITEEKQAQAVALRTAEELTQFVDTANAPIFGIDSNGLVNEWNQTAEKITGFSKAEVFGKDLVAEFITDEYKAPVKQVLDNALSGDETANYEFPLYTKTSQRVDVLLNATTRRNVEGLVIGVIGVGQDITELRQKQKALNQAGKMETVGQLTGGIAHDFNNLLSIIDGNLRFLQQDIGDVGEEIEELFEDAMSATADGAELTARLLAFSRNRVSKPELKEVNESIHNFSRFLSRTLGNANELRTRLAEEDLYINVDASQFENALLNVLINARDAMLDGGNITISSELYRHSDSNQHEGIGEQRPVLEPGDHVVVSVEDTGVGIAKDDLARVFEPFFTTKDVGKGTGLGLSMVYGFIQESNAVCDIRSELGEGTKVSMYFPAAKNMAQESRSADSNDIEVADSEVILVVEDEARVRRVALRDLQKLGYRTLEADRAEMAKTIIQSGQKIDLMFSDVLMPGEVDGQTLGLWVEKNYPEIKVVLTSGFTKRKTEVKENVSSFPLLRKPYTIEALAKQIRATLHDNE